MIYKWPAKRSIPNLYKIEMVDGITLMNIENFQYHLIDMFCSSPGLEQLFYKPDRLINSWEENKLSFKNQISKTEVQICLKVLDFSEIY